ncbi:MAG: DUF4249 domain-containing protein [Flavobacteriaceae bacterium CG02_land_8_20_14_3_00_34_13]|nr:MAG: DUF4249 domain-containing protein [Flavobacteriaceae bacterium CG02_land_8_20_14_3_00_34_13]
MKLVKIITIFLAISLSSCEEVIDLDLNEANTKLVIDASINLEEDGSTFAFIKLTTTAPFFNTNIPFVADATVSITDENGIQYPFTHSENGIYLGNLIPQDSIDYTLNINYKNELYTATTHLETAVPIEFIEQRNDGGFTGKDIELKAYFTDPAGVPNFYFFEGLSSKGDSFDALKDTFFDGNLIFGYYLVEDIAPGDTVHFNLYGINETNYNFLFTLLLQTESPGGPFETQPASVRGNITNQTNPENFPLGYFRISEVYRFSYTVQ